MATNTYVALDKTTVGTATSTITFTGISQAYTDLVIVANFDGSASSYTTLTFNGITGSSYSRTRLIGNGSTVTSDRTNNTAGIINLTYNTAGTPVTGIYQVFNYANTTTYKTIICRDASQPDNVSAHAGMFRGSTGSATDAITSITLTKASGNYTVGSTFSLYGITSEIGGSTPKAIGGTVTSDATYWYHTFTTSGSFVPNQSLSCDVLAIAGGGGSSAASGGGGAGGVQYATSQSVTATNYSVLIGAGGALSASGGVGHKGTNTIFGSTISANGGGAGTRTAGTTTGTGGSGGGVANANTPGSSSAGTGGTFYGNAGSAGGGSSYGGGGGAGQAGQITSGGNGLNTWSDWASATGTGVAGYYAGGGGPVQNAPSGPFAGGLGGGGAGGISANPTAGAGVAGTINTGSGAGGGGIGSTTDGSGAAGGSGIVIVRYTKA